VKHSWLLLLIGWLVGSFFGLGAIMGMFGKAKSPAPAAA
jgi:hypothetical protein